MSHYLATCGASNALANAAVFIVALIISILLALAVYRTTDKVDGPNLPPVK